MGGCTFSSVSHFSGNHRCLRTSIAIHEIPDALVSDNGSCFTSRKFELFSKLNGIGHLKSAPYHSATNGLAERAVQSIKQALRKTEVQTFSEKLQKVLMAMRNTPHTTTALNQQSCYWDKG